MHNGKIALFILKMALLLSNFYEIMPKYQKVESSFLSLSQFILKVNKVNTSQEHLNKINKNTSVCTVCIQLRIKFYWVDFNHTFPISILWNVTYVEDAIIPILWLTLIWYVINLKSQCSKMTHSFCRFEAHLGRKASHRCIRSATFEPGEWGLRVVLLGHFCTSPHVGHVRRKQACIKLQEYLPESQIKTDKLTTHRAWLDHTWWKISLKLKGIIPYPLWHQSTDLVI